LLELARSGSAHAPLSPLTGAPHVLVELDPHEPPAAAGKAQLSAWLRRQACPVIGIAAAGERHVLAVACDAVASSAADAAELVTSIEAAPVAAMVLVQVLRATEAMEIAPALVVESLAYATLQAGSEFRQWLTRTPRPAADREVDPGPAVSVGRHGAHLHLRLNRPARRNALSVEMRDALVEALELVELDPSIASVTLSGAGSCFSAGGDLSEFGSAADPALAHAVRSTRPVAQLLARCAPRLRFHVHGAAVGAGLEIAAFGAHLEATPETFFQLPEIRFGLIPGSGGCVSIPRRIGRLRTAHMALSGRRIDAHTACEWGLVDKLVPGKALAGAGGSPVALNAGYGA
jgi:enoyl-CoA hydratase